jgi:hypothetical protein
LAKFRPLVVRRVLTLVLLTAVTAHADFLGHARLWLGNGVDTNAKREFVTPNVETAPDLFFFGLGQLEGIARFGKRVRLVGGYDVGARKFITQPSQDTIVQSAQLEATVSFFGCFAFGVAGRARDRRGAERDYTDLQGGAVLDFFPDPAVDVRVQINAHRFLFYNRFAYSFWGPDGSLSARYRFNRRHSVSVFGSYNPRTYNANALAQPGPEGTDPDLGIPRSDAVFGGGVTYTYRGPFHFSFSYSYFDQTSNSFGESVKRHRLAATGGVQLPWKLTLLASLTWQPSLFPDGVYLNPDLSIVEDDENVSSATLKLVRPLTSWLDIDLRYAGYLGIYPQNNFLYFRNVVSIGFTASY